MGENPQIEILFEPTWDVFMFGDAYIALAMGGIVSENEEGKKVVDFIIKPSNLLRKRYNIPDSALDVNLCMPFRVFESDLLPLNMFDPANRHWLYIKNFKHESTALSEISWKLRKENEELRERITMLEGENVWLTEQLYLAKTNPQQFLAQSTELLDRVFGKVAEIIQSRKPEEKIGEI